MHWLFRRTLWATLLVLGFISTSSRWARADTSPSPADELTISLLTFGPGDHPFTKFGHNGLLVEDKVRGTSVVYNYGTFAFGSIALIPKFLLGKYRYWLSVQRLDATLAVYAADNRSVVAQELALTAQEKRMMAEFLAWNARDENKYYLFDYYRDNCATRVRDLVDRATAGALSRISTDPADTTWRGHTERLTADDLPVFLGLYVAMGNVIDRPITRWEEMFLPSKLAVGVKRAGLVARETVLLDARRPPLRPSPPSWSLRALLAGIVAAVGLVALGRVAARGFRGARALAGITLASLGLIFGILGCLFVFLWAFTNHEVAHHNENILPCTPLALGLAAHGVRMARGVPRSALHARTIALVGFACSLLGLVLKLLPWFSQENGLVLAFAIPVWGGAALAAHAMVATATFLPARRAGSNDAKSSRGVMDVGAPSPNRPSDAASDATTAPGDAPAPR